MYGEEIRAFVIIYQGKIIFFESLQIKQKENQEQEVNNLLNSQMNSIKKSKNIQKMSTQCGVWYYVQDSDDRIFFCLTSVKYRMPQVSQLIQEISQKLSFQSDKSLIESHLKNDIYNQLRYYDSNPQEDVLSDAQKNITSISDAMKENVNKMIGNSEHLQSIEVKSMELDSMSRQFSRDSRRVKDQMRQRMIRQRIMIAVIFLIAIIGLYFVFFYGDDETKEKKKKKVQETATETKEGESNGSQ